MALQSLRKEIDEIDEELLRLFLKRMNTSRKIALEKQKSGLPLYHPGREAEVIAKAREAAGREMAGYAQAYFENIMALSRKIQGELLAKK